MATGAKFTPASDLFGAWRACIESGDVPALWKLGVGDLATIEVGPGRVLLLGGMPGAGKTALVMQLVLDGLRLNPELRAAVMNVEMAPEALMTRQLARVSKVDATMIRKGKLVDADKLKLAQGFGKLEPQLARLAFVGAPYTLQNAVESAAGFGSALVVLDYIQRIAPGGKHPDKRESVNASMELVRGMADAGMGVIVVAAVNRPSYTGKKGGSGATLGSFRESSELEYGADDAYILTAGANCFDPCELQHLKSRNGELKSFPLSFDRPRQSFTATDFDPSKLKPAKIGS